MSTKTSFFVYWSTSNPTQNFLFTDFIKILGGAGAHYHPLYPPPPAISPIPLHPPSVPQNSVQPSPITSTILQNSLDNLVFFVEAPQSFRKHFSSSLHANFSLNQVLQFLMFTIWEQANIMA